MILAPLLAQSRPRGNFRILLGFRADGHRAAGMAARPVTTHRQERSWVGGNQNRTPLPRPWAY
jgi:hypothetical protein